jgi:hypothetical protein
MLYEVVENISRVQSTYVSPVQYGHFEYIKQVPFTGPLDILDCLKTYARALAREYQHPPQNDFIVRRAKDWWVLCHHLANRINEMISRLATLMVRKRRQTRAAIEIQDAVLHHLHKPQGVLARRAVNRARVFEGKRPRRLIRMDEVRARLANRS